MRVFYFNVTYRCNSNCIFCAADHPLSHNNNEMSLQEFTNVLNINRVGAGDRVIVNGGEPTVHHDFFGLLDAIQERNATIDLFTNGVRLKDKEMAHKLLSYRKLHIRIPLFGGTAEFHDKVTGCPGNFAATTAALDIISKNLPDDACLEIKMLLARSTIEENELIYDLAKERWMNERVMLSLNPLLISHCVVQQKDLFIDTYESLMEKSESLIRRIYHDGYSFSMDLIPYCTFPSKDLLDLCHGNGEAEEHYTDHKDSFIKTDNKKSGACQECRYVQKCFGFTQGYINYFGETVKKPIK